jgi:hypothetical protein
MKAFGLAFVLAITLACVFSHASAASPSGPPASAIKAQWTVRLSATDTLIFGDDIPVASPVWHFGPAGMDTLEYERGWPLTCLNAKSGRAIWARPLPDAGVPICITKDGYWSIKLDNPKSYYGKGLKSRYAICLNNASSGALIRKWKLPLMRQIFCSFGHWQGKPYQLISTSDSPDRTCISLEIIYRISITSDRVTYNKLSKNAAVVQTRRRCNCKLEYESGENSVPLGKAVYTGF